MADVHLGGWKQKPMQDLNFQSFRMALDICIKENVEFILIAGDLFNTSLPAMDCLKIVVKKFKELNDNDISIYLIAGSHDFSPSGKTILDVLESAGLFTNVTKGQVIDGKLRLDFTVDKKTNAKIVHAQNPRSEPEQRKWHLSSALAKKARRLVLFTNVDGIYAGKALVREINSKNAPSILMHVGNSNHADVTGGMRGKLLEILKAKKPAFIANGSKPHVVRNVLLGKNAVCTRIN